MKFQKENTKKTPITNWIGLVLISGAFLALAAGCSNNQKQQQVEDIHPVSNQTYNVRIQPHKEGEIWHINRSIKDTQIVDVLKNGEEVGKEDGNQSVRTQMATLTLVEMEGGLPRKITMKLIPNEDSVEVDGEILVTATWNDRRMDLVFDPPEAEQNSSAKELALYLVNHFFCPATGTREQVLMDSLKSNTLMERAQFPVPISLGHLSHWQADGMLDATLWGGGTEMVTVAEGGKQTIGGAETLPMHFSVFYEHSEGPENQEELSLDVSLFPTLATGQWQLVLINRYHTYLENTDEEGIQRKIGDLHSVEETWVMEQLSAPDDPASPASEN